MLVGKTIHHVENSKDLTQEMAEVLIEEHEIFCRQIDITTYQIRKIKADTSLCLFADDFNSHDVVSLFTNVPIPQAMDVVRNRLEEDDILKSRTLFSIKDIMSLLEFFLPSNYYVLCV